MPIMLASISAKLTGKNSEYHGPKGDVKQMNILGRFAVMETIPIINTTVIISGRGLWTSEA